MKGTILFVIILLAGAGGAETKKTTGTVRQNAFNGTWCTGEDGMVLSFSGKDSIHVKSSSDESVGGGGIYTRTDSTFVATLRNGDMVVKMSYLFRWKGIDTVEARATAFTINGENVDVPPEWMSMVRCEGAGTTQDLR